MRWNHFGGTLLFGAVAAAATLPWVEIVAPGLGLETALGSYAVLNVAIYLAGLAATPRQGFGAAAFAVLLGGLAFQVASSPREQLLVAALILGLLRSGLLYRAGFGRALLLEAVLLCGGLVVAARLFSGTTASLALAVWGFFLVQSVFFLVSGVTQQRDGAEGLDPFDDARAHAVAILEELAEAPPRQQVYGEPR